MYTAAQLRLLARLHTERAEAACEPAQRGMLQVMAAEFERDARIADKEERLEARRMRPRMSDERCEIADLAA